MNYSLYVIKVYVQYLLMDDVNSFSLDIVLNIEEFYYHFSLMWSLILLKWNLLTILSKKKTSKFNNVRSIETIASIRPCVFSAIQSYCPKSSLLSIYSNTYLTMNRISINMHTWIVNRLVVIVWLTRVFVILFFSIILPFFSQDKRGNGRPNAWHSIVIFWYSSLGIKSLLTNTTGGSIKKKELIHFLKSNSFLHSTLIVNIRFDAGKTPLSAIHSTVRGNVVAIDGINHILLLSGGTKKNKMKIRLTLEYKSINNTKKFKYTVYLTLVGHHDTCLMKKFHIVGCPIVLFSCLTVYLSVSLRNMIGISSLKVIASTKKKERACEFVKRLLIKDWTHILINM